MSISLYPLRFRPFFRNYLWGGRRLETVLGKKLPPGDDWAESWEVCDHDADQSIVEAGTLAGTQLGKLVADRGAELFGRHAPQRRFPLLFKFLDASQTLSVQVHPNDRQAALLTPPDLGKTEALVVMDARPGSLIYAGLKKGVTFESFGAALRAGRCEECLHSFEPSPGDCVLAPAGVVHAYGAGLLLAEIQQASDVTYRLFDWNRLGPDGRPRALHIEDGLKVVDFERGPVFPEKPRETGSRATMRLTECDRFVIDRLSFDSPLSVGGDERFHIIVVLEGAVEIEGDPAGSELAFGRTGLLPAALGAVEVYPLGKTVILDMYMP